MAVSYNKLWKLMIDKKINKSQLCKKIKISSSTMARHFKCSGSMCAGWKLSL